MQKQGKDLIAGESLNIAVGSYPFADEKISEKVKLQIMKIFYEKYAITEADFVSAELEAVPAFRACDVGLDSSMIGGYGQDDRSCAYAAMTAALAVRQPAYTTVCALMDKEETGSDGNTGTASSFLKYFMEDLAGCFGEASRHVFSKSKCISADVCAAF